MKESNFVSAVVYLRQCRESVVPFLTRLHATLRENFRKFELICVDDASDDGSGRPIFFISAQSTALAVRSSMQSTTQSQGGMTVDTFSGVTKDTTARTSQSG